jgi:NADH-quinone oxidoreductase subunit M
MLTAIIILPILAALLLALIPRNFRFVFRLGALVTTAVTMLLAVLVFWRFDGSIPGFQFETQIQSLKILRMTFNVGVEQLGISYHVGVDGLNVALIFMGAIVAFGAACVSWEIRTSEKEFYILLLLMTGGILGAFASLDLFFFYFFHELALVPTFIMIGVWGRGPNKNYATFNITLYLSLGALIALIGLIALYLQMPAGSRTFDIPAMINYFRDQPISTAVQQWIFPVLMFGFGILVALFPFHTWAPQAYAAAPTATAMLHAGVLKKFGLYGLIRIALPLLPDGAKHWLYVLGFLCIGNILHSGWVAMRQRDLNLLIGNSSVAHMGFVFLGIASLNLIGITGAVLVMVAHGFLAALSFGLTGYIYQQTSTLDMDRLGGLLRRLPFIGAALLMAALAGCGLPGFANFPGELMVLFGAWKGMPATCFAIAALWGALIIAAIYMLRGVRNVLHGPIPENLLEVNDATPWRKVPFALLLAGLLGFGILPGGLIERIKPAAEQVLKVTDKQNLDLPQTVSTR